MGNGAMPHGPSYRAHPRLYSIGMPTVRLFEGPDNGVVTTDKAKDFLPFPQTNIRSKCNGRRVTGLQLFYQSATEFFGVDREAANARRPTSFR